MASVFHRVVVFQNGSSAVFSKSLVQTSLRSFSSKSRFLKLLNQDSENNNKKIRSKDARPRTPRYNDDNSDTIAEDKLFISIPERVKNNIHYLHTSDPTKWTIDALCKKFGFSRSRVNAIIYLKSDELKMFGTLSDDEITSEEDGTQRSYSSNVYNDMETPDHDPTLEGYGEKPRFMRFNDDEEILLFSKRPKTKDEKTSSVKYAKDVENCTPIKELPSFTGFPKQIVKSKYAIRDLSASKNDLIIRDYDQTLRTPTQFELESRTWMPKKGTFVDLK